MARAYQRGFLYLLCLGLLTIMIDISGVFRHPLEKDYYTEFSYPLDIPDFPSVVTRYRNKEPIAYDPITSMYTNLTYLTKASGGCPGPFRLIILVKSAPGNFDKRGAIRTTWGFPRRFSDVAIKTVFLLGEIQDPLVKARNSVGEKVQLGPAITEEISNYNDIVRADFLDSYYNNTIKTMMGMRWLVETCSDFRFAFFVDDDMYVSVKNLLKFVRHPVGYPDYWEKQKEKDEKKLNLQHTTVARKMFNATAKSSVNKYTFSPVGKMSAQKAQQIKVWKNSHVDFDIELDEDAKLYGGYVFFVPPHRHKIGTKWFLPLSEYPYNYFPPYVPAGAIIMSRSALMDIYYASLFTKHFRFDDIYIAICAKKMNIEPFHTNYFRFWPAPVKDPYENEYKYLITSHGYDDPDELRSFWNIQKSLGHA